MEEISRAEEIKLQRIAIGWTQEQAGAAIYAKRRTWQDWERGVREMPEAKFELWQRKVMRKFWRGK